MKNVFLAVTIVLSSVFSLAQQDSRQNEVALKKWLSPITNIIYHKSGDSGCEKFMLTNNGEFIGVYFGDARTPKEELLFTNRSKISIKNLSETKAEVEVDEPHGLLTNSSALKIKFEIERGPMGHLNSIQIYRRAQTLFSIPTVITCRTQNP